MEFVGRFEPKEPWLTDWPTPSDGTDLFVADVTGDGYVDLLSKDNKVPSDWYVARGNGSAFISQAQPL